jgi:hypothetical protein
MEDKKPRQGKPSPALRRLEKLIGVWKIEGHTLDSNRNIVSGQVTIEWLPGGFFMIQRGEIAVNEFKVHALEVIGYDPSTKVFPSYVYSDVAGFPSRYYWDIRGNVAKHWTKGARYNGKFSEDGNTLSGGWRPIGRQRKTQGNNYNAVMTRVS